MANETHQMREELVIHHTGEVINLEDPNATAQALRHVRDLRESLRDTERILVDALVTHSTILATKTMHLNATTVKVAGDTITLYDADKIEEGLLTAGMPPQRVSEIVREQVTVVKKVNGTEAKKAARMNPAYAAVIDAHSTVVEKTPTVTVT